MECFIQRRNRLVVQLTVAIMLAGCGAQDPAARNDAALKDGAHTSKKTTPGRYILFTTQRSGSTWFCDVLGRQPGVQCGLELSRNEKKSTYHPSRTTEMMIKYSHMKRKVIDGYDYSNITWEKWRADSEQQFERLAANYNSGKASVIGYKLMYDQVPPRLINEFIEYVSKEDICIVHLERVVLLQVASHLQTIHGKMHNTNASEAAASRASTRPVAAPFEVVRELVKAKIAQNHEWTQRLRYAPGARYYHVAYEQLTGKAAGNYLRSVIAFVLNKGENIDLGSVSLASDLQRLHEASCRKRFEPSLYAQLRQSFSEQALWCDVLDA